MLEIPIGIVGSYWGGTKIEPWIPAEGYASVGLDPAKVGQQAQAKFAAEESNAGLAVINDLGNLTDIHPNEKLTAAKRLAVHALKRDYGFGDIRDDSPTFRDFELEKDRVVLGFDNVDEFYIYNHDYGSTANGFEICGANGVWKPAKIVNFRDEKRKARSRFRGNVNGNRIVLSTEGG